MSVAYRSGLRISSAAPRIALALPLPPAGVWRRRRAILSTPMMASSMTAPRAITNPVMIMRLTGVPSTYRTVPAVITDRRIDAAPTRAVRQVEKKTSRARPASIAPRRMVWPILDRALSRKVAGRKSVGSISRPVSPGWRALSAFST